MADFDDAVQDVRDQYKMAIPLMLKSAREATEPKAIQAFLVILQAYYKEQVEVLNAIKEAGKILQDKLKQQTTIDDL